MELDFLSSDNERHDRELPPEKWGGTIRSAWNPATMIRRGRLTDRKIEKYIREGYYSAEYRQARKELQLKKRKERREGNFVESNGRWVYSPI